MRTTFRARQLYADIFLRCADEFVCNSPVRPERFMKKMRENTGMAGGSFIQTCELDPMRLEGEAYVKLLRDAGVPVRAHCFPGVLHGFSEGPDELGQAGRQWIIDAVKDLKWTE